MVATFSEAGGQVPKSWRELGVQLGLNNLEGHLSASEFFEGWSKDRSKKTPSWEELARVLQHMDGYEDVGSKAMEKARKNILWRYL